MARIRWPGACLALALLVTIPAAAEPVPADPSFADQRSLFSALSKARYAARSGQEAIAIDLYEQLLASAPELVEAQLGLARLLVRAGRVEPGFEAYGNAVRLAPSNPDVRLAEVFALIHLGRWSEARQRLEQARPATGDDPAILTALVRVLSAAPDDDARDAVKARLLGRQLAVEPITIDDAATLAMVAAESGELDAALDWQKRAIDLARREGHTQRLPELVANYRQYQQGRPCRSPWPVDDPRLRDWADPTDDDLPVTEILARTVTEADPEENPFLNDLRIELFDRKIAAAERVTQQQDLRYQKAYEYLRAGRTSEAIADTERLIEELRAEGHADDSPKMLDLRHLRAMSYMRLGEQENCIAHHTIDSCLMPISGSGQHTEQRGSRTAIDELTGILQVDPESLTARWLLNLARMTLGEWPEEVPPQWLIPPMLFDSDHDPGRFFDVAPDLGVAIPDRAGGVAMEDFDRDGRLDLIASSWGIRDQLQYFHNNGDGTFADWTERAGLVGQLGGLNLIHADYDNDGYADVLVLRGAWLRTAGQIPNSLLRNNGDGTFTDVTREAGLLSFRPTQTAAWADFNLDGWLDLFVGNEAAPGEPHPSELYLNNADGTFTDVAPLVGLDIVGFVKGVAWGDFDNDGLPDLYVSRYSEPNQLFKNDGPEGGLWRFTDVTRKAGVAEPRFSFPVWFFDYDNDGWEDLFAASLENFFSDSLEVIVADYLGVAAAAQSALFRNNGDGTFTEIAKNAGLDDALLAMGANFGDLDNDGYLDCYIGTGQPRLNTLVPNRMYRNAGGRTFQDVTTAGGFGHLQKGHGIAFGDMDDDGDQDIYAVMGGAFTGDGFQNALFENPGHGNHWITLRLEGVRSNRMAVGARIRVTVADADGTRDIHVTAGTGGSFGSSSLQQEIGLGQAGKIEALEIAWPTWPPTVQTFTNVPMDRVLRIREGKKPRVLKTRPIRMSGKVEAGVP